MTQDEARENELYKLTLAITTLRVMDVSNMPVESMRELIHLAITEIDSLPS